MGNEKTKVRKLLMVAAIEKQLSGTLTWRSRVKLLTSDSMPSTRVIDINPQIIIPTTTMSQKFSADTFKTTLKTK